MYARHRHAPGQVDNFCGLADIALDVSVAADGNNGAVVNGRGFRPATPGIDRVDATVEQNQVGDLLFGLFSAGCEN